MIGRVAWGGPVVPFGSVMPAPATSVTVHHSLAPALLLGAPPQSERAAMWGIHIDHTKKKWAGIGYNFCITQNGNVFEGRGWGRVGAHAGTAEGNRTSIGVCFLIDGRKTAPTSYARDALAQLRWDGVQLGHLLPAHTLKFHRDWKATECPGDAVVAALAGATQLPATVVLRKGDRSDDVRALQDLLVRFGYMSAAQQATGPGIFGPQTEAAFRVFLTAHGT